MIGYNRSYVQVILVGNIRNKRTVIEDIVESDVMKWRDLYGEETWEKQIE